MIVAVILCLAGVVVIPALLFALSIPLAIIISLLPWLLRVAGVVLLVKALLEKPSRWESFLPAAGAFLLSWAVRWIF